MGGNLKKLMVNGLLMLALMVLSGSVYAGDLGNQIKSGINGLSKGDFGGVASGVNNFVGASLHSAGQWTGAQVNNIHNDLDRGLSSPTLYKAAAMSGLGLIGLAYNNMNQGKPVSQKVKMTEYPDSSKISSGLFVKELAEPGKGAFDPKLGAATITREVSVAEKREILRLSQ
jgi:hypothetical protein